MTSNTMLCGGQSQFPTMHRLLVSNEKATLDTELHTQTSKAAKIRLISITINALNPSTSFEFKMYSEANFISVYIPQTVLGVLLA